MEHFTTLGWKLFAIKATATRRTSALVATGGLPAAGERRVTSASRARVASRQRQQQRRLRQSVLDGARLSPHTEPVGHATLPPRIETRARTVTLRVVTSPASPLAGEPLIKQSTAYDTTAIAGPASR